LITVEEGTSDISVTGRALSNDDIVEFTRNLQQGKIFSSVALEESRQMLDEGVTVYQFKIKLKVKA
jgi:Tfp pilus assembly protein PilN